MLHAMIGQIRVDPRHSSEQPVTLAVRIVLLGFCAMCTGTALAAAPVFFGLGFPDTVAGFRRGAIIDFEKDHPGLGYGVRYSGNGWAIDVFIYDDGYKDLPDSLSADVVVRQFGQARGDIYKNQAERRGTVEDKDRFTIAGPDQKVRFSCGTNLIDNGRKIDSYLCLTVWNGKFVKYRLSVLSDTGSTAVAKRFVSSGTGLLWP